MFTTTRHAHFIGTGGIGMSGIAEIFLSLRMKVSGSGFRRCPVTDRLAVVLIKKICTLLVRSKAHKQCALFPWIDNGNARMLEVINVPCRNRESIRRGNRGNVRIRRRGRLTDLLAACANLSQLLGSLDVELQHSVLEQLQRSLDLRGKIVPAFAVRHFQHPETQLGIADRAHI
jgi:hypothetical protein